MGITHTEVTIIVVMLLVQILWLSFIEFHLVKVLEFLVDWRRKREEEKDG